MPDDHIVCSKLGMWWGCFKECFVRVSASCRLKEVTGKKTRRRKECRCAQRHKCVVLHRRKERENGDRVSTLICVQDVGRGARWCLLGREQALRIVPATIKSFDFHQSLQLWKWKESN
jgi:hypothetical protein